MKRTTIMIRFWVLLLGVLMLPGAAAAQTTVFTDFVSFDAATGSLTEIDFENLHSLTVDGITFRDPLNLHIGFCSSPTCQIDPDNPLGGNNVLFLNTGGDINFPVGTADVNLIVQGMGNTSFTVEVTDFSGGTFIANGAGIAFSVAILSLTSPNSIQQIEVLSTGGGPLVLSAVETFDSVGNPLSEIDFESFPPEVSCILSVCIDTFPFFDPLVPNPLTMDGVTFTDPFQLDEGFCSSPTCQIDPDNPIGNIVLFLNPGGTIDFPPGTGGAMLVIEGMGNNPFTVQVTDFAGNTSIAAGQGVSFGVAFLGFTSPSGISRIEVLSVGGTGGPLVLSAVFYGVTLQQAVQLLTDEIADLVASGVLNQGQGNSLTAKLQAAINSLNNGNTTAACNQLQAFINQVNALISRGVLSLAEGQPLVNVADDIANELGC